MFTTSADGVRIHYELIETGAPALVLQHGFTDCLESWYDNGWVPRLSRWFTLVLLDARGHGRSDKPPAPEAYAMHHRVADLLAVLDAAGIERSAYFGYSMGGRIGFEAAAAAPERFQALALGGSHPFAQSLQPLRRGIENGLESWIKAIEVGTGRRLPAPLRERLLVNDVGALAACVADDRPDRSDVLDRLTVPVLLFAGSEDPLRQEAARAARSLRAGEFLEVPGWNHLALGASLDVVLPAVERFLQCRASTSK